MSQAPPQLDEVFGQEHFASENDDYNQLVFVVQSLLSGVNVATLVKVMGVTPGAGGAAGTVDVLPLLNQVTGNGLGVEHTTVYGLPFFRLQGGANAVVCDPAMGDLGLAVFCDRDTSAIVNQPTSALSVPGAMPGSYRRFNFSDGFYLGGWGATVVPSQFVQFLVGSLLLQTPAVNTPTEYQVAGTKVVGSQQSTIVPLAITGSAADPIARQGVNDLISRLQAHGLIA